MTTLNNMLCCKNHNNFFFSANFAKGHIYCEALQFPIVFIITFKQEEKKSVEQRIFIHKL